MTVAELITLLQTCLQDRRVVVRGYEGGVDDVNAVKTVNIKVNANEEWYYGRHEDIYSKDDPYDEQAYHLSV